MENIVGIQLNESYCSPFVYDMVSQCDTGYFDDIINVKIVLANLPAVQETSLRLCSKRSWTLSSDATGTINFHRFLLWCKYRIMKLKTTAIVMLSIVMLSNTLVQIT